MKDFDLSKQKTFQGYPFEKCVGIAVLSEPGENMQLTVTLPKTAWCVKDLDNKFKNLKNSLRCQDCADAAIWLLTETKQWELHIFELKKTVIRSSDKTGWNYIKNQFIGARRLCKMLAGVFEINFERVIFYTVCTNDDDISGKSNDQSDRGNSPDPVSAQGTFDGFDRDPRKEWKDEKCYLSNDEWSNYSPKDYNKVYTHIPIKLSEQNEDTFTGTSKLISG